MAKGVAIKSGTVPAHLCKAMKQPPKTKDVLSQIGDFLNELGYTESLKALKSEAKKNGNPIDVQAWSQLQTQDKKHGTSGFRLLDFWTAVSKRARIPSLDDPQADEDSEESESEDEEADGGAVVDVEAEVTSDDSSDEESDATSESSTKPGQKRKRQLTPDSSSGSSSDEESSSEGEAMEHVKVDSSDSNSSSDSSSSDEDERPVKKAKTTNGSVKKGKAAKASDTSSDSSSESDSASASSSSSSESDVESSSDSDSSSSDSSAPPPKKTKKAAKGKRPILSTLNSTDAAATRNGSTGSSSATLAAESPVETTPKETDTLLIDQGNNETKEIPATKANIKKLKKDNTPFSRIPANQQVDPRFASNAYVSYDYADRAHRDLIVTKGKGFTKEKNKKKRGSYRGGAIDTTPKAIKFDD